MIEYCERCGKELSTLEKLIGEFTNQQRCHSCRNKK